MSGWYSTVLGQHQVHWPPSQEKYCFIQSGLNTLEVYGIRSGLYWAHRPFDWRHTGEASENTISTWAPHLATPHCHPLHQTPTHRSHHQGGHCEWAASRKYKQEGWLVSEIVGRGSMQGHGGTCPQFLAPFLSYTPPPLPAHLSPLLVSVLLTTPLHFPPFLS
jgi:hypothetical protein